MIAASLILLALFVVLLAGISRTWRHDWPRPHRAESIEVGPHSDADLRRRLLAGTLDTDRHR